MPHLEQPNYKTHCPWCGMGYYIPVSQLQKQNKKAIECDSCKKHFVVAVKVAITTEAIYEPILCTAGNCND